MLYAKEVTTRMDGNYAGLPVDTVFLSDFEKTAFDPNKLVLVRLSNGVEVYLHENESGEPHIVWSYHVSCLSVTHRAYWSVDETGDREAETLFPVLRFVGGNPIEDIDDDCS